MRNLLRLSAVMLSLGMLGASACSSCSQTPEDTSTDSVVPPHSFTCGAYTHRVGNQCIGDTVSNQSSGGNTSSSVLGTNGNN